MIITVYSFMIVSFPMVFLCYAFCNDVYDDVYVCVYVYYETCAILSYCVFLYSHFQ